MGSCFSSYLAACAVHGNVNEDNIDMIFNTETQRHKGTEASGCAFGAGSGVVPQLLRTLCL